MPVWGILIMIFLRCDTLEIIYFDNFPVYPFDKSYQYHKGLFREFLIKTCPAFPRQEAFHLIRKPDGLISLIKEKIKLW
jgi:hypothetical protein